MKKQLEPADYELLACAREAIVRNYDAEQFHHTVGAAVRCADGQIFTGVNLYSMHGACAEQVALGAAVTAGQREFTRIVAVRGAQGEEVVPPCGNCRQILLDYAPKCAVILEDTDGMFKLYAEELLPFAFRVEG